MKISEINRTARNNEFAAFFRKLYNHSVKLMESLPDDEMAKILSKMSGYEDTVAHARDGSVIQEYEIKLLDGIWFGNPIKTSDCETGERHLDKVIMFSESFVQYQNHHPLLDCFDMQLCMDEECCFDSFFDYRHLNIKFYLGRNMVYVEREFSEVDLDVDVSTEDQAFLAALCKEEFLKAIFGNHLIDVYPSGDGFPGFTVSADFFKEP